MKEDMLACKHVYSHKLSSHDIGETTLSPLNAHARSPDYMLISNVTRNPTSVILGTPLTETNTEAGVT